LRIDSLFFGVGLAYLYHFKSHWLKPLTRHYNIFLFLGILLISPMMFLELEKSPFVWTFGFTLLYLGYGCILLAMVYTPVSQGTMGRWFNSLPAQVIAFIGNFSYPIYLWHIDLGQNPLLELVSHGFLSNFSVSMRWFCVMMLFILVAVLTGTVLGIIVEKPSLALRDRLFPRRTDGIKQH
jgi:peptidoglycan/LPS O-acetylase OafA/YrhL